MQGGVPDAVCDAHEACGTVDHRCAAWAVAARMLDMFLDKWQYTIAEMEGVTYGQDGRGIPVLTYIISTSIKSAIFFNSSNDFLFSFSPAS